MLIYTIKTFFEEIEGECNTIGEFKLILDSHRNDVEDFSIKNIYGEDLTPEYI